MVDRLFAYGTLLAPELRCAVLGRALAGKPATLSGYACYRVSRAAYPAVVEQAAGHTNGELFSGIAASEWDALDEFESRLYERRLVEIEAAGTRLGAYTYVVAETMRECLTDEAWDLERFRRNHLERYLARL